MGDHSPRGSAGSCRISSGRYYGNDMMYSIARPFAYVPITALIVLGNESALANHLQSALRIGTTKEELMKLITQLV
jgi:hypothetical protein